MTGAEFLDGGRFDAFADMKRTLASGHPWESIVDFALHKSFCGKKLYPRQLTLLKLIYLETEQMTDYDLDVINGWREGFKRHRDIMGVPPDIWDRVEYLQDNGYHHFTHVQFVGGRRGSKGIEGSLLGAERLAHFYCLDDWQMHYGIDPGTVGDLTVVSTSQATASRRQFADIRRTVEKCAYLRRHIVGNKYTEFSIRTPADERQIDEMRIAKIPIDREIASLYVCASSTVSSSIRGGAVFMTAYDEMAHMIMGTDSTKSGEEIYEALQPSLDQFGKDQLTYIPSSPYTKIGKFYELYQQGIVTLDVYNEREGALEQRSFTEKMLGVDAEAEFDASVAEPEWLVVQLPSWELYTDWEKSHTIPIRKNSTHMGPAFKNPVQWPPDGHRPENTRMKRLERRNPDKFKVERRAQFASVVDAYLDEAMVDAMFDHPGWRPTPGRAGPRHPDARLPDARRPLHHQRELRLRHRAPGGGALRRLRLAPGCQCLPARAPAHLQEGRPRLAARDPGQAQGLEARGLPAPHPGLRHHRRADRRLLPELHLHHQDQLRPVEQRGLPLRTAAQVRRAHPHRGEDLHREGESHPRRAVQELSESGLGARLPGQLLRGESVPAWRPS